MESQKGKKIYDDDVEIYSDDIKVCDVDVKT